MISGLTVSSRLPLGIAGVLAGCFGVAGAVVGMAEVWYIGPLGAMAGTEFGADLGFEVSLVAAIVLLNRPDNGVLCNSLQLHSQESLILLSGGLRLDSQDDKHVDVLPPYLYFVPCALAFCIQKYFICTNRYTTISIEGYVGTLRPE